LVRVTAPPVEFAANTALERILADGLNVPKSAISIIAGIRSRLKTVEIDGLSEAEARFRLSDETA
jgi:uncharacterized protein YggU (UPF0235/DUF167 family)